MSEACCSGEHLRGESRCGARYANHFEVGFSGQEVLLNLGQHYDALAPATIHTRLVTTPAYARALSEALARALVEFERAYGPIPALAQDETER